MSNDVLESIKKIIDKRVLLSIKEVYNIQQFILFTFMLKFQHTKAKCNFFNINMNNLVYNNTFSISNPIEH